jgi:hypothetical protein
MIIILNSNSNSLCQNNLILLEMLLMISLMMGKYHIFVILVLSPAVLLSFISSIPVCRLSSFFLLSSSFSFHSQFDLQPMYPPSSAGGYGGGMPAAVAGGGRGQMRNNIMFPQQLQAQQQQQFYYDDDLPLNNHNNLIPSPSNAQFVRNSFPSQQQQLLPMQQPQSQQQFVRGNPSVNTIPASASLNKNVMMSMLQNTLSNDLPMQYPNMQNQPGMLMNRPQGAMRPAMQPQQQHQQQSMTNSRMNPNMMPIPGGGGVISPRGAPMNPLPNNRGGPGLGPVPVPNNNNLRDSANFRGNYPASSSSVSRRSDRGYQPY